LPLGRVVVVVVVDAEGPKKIIEKKMSNF